MVSSLHSDAQSADQSVTEDTVILERRVAELVGEGARIAANQEAQREEAVEMVAADARTLVSPALALLNTHTRLQMFAFGKDLPISATLVNQLRMIL